MWSAFLFKAFQTDNLQNNPLGAPEKNPVPIKLSINKKEAL